MSAQTSSTEWVVGWHPVFAVLKTRPEGVVQVWLERGRADSRAKALEALVKEYGLTFQKVDRKQLDAVITTGQHQGIGIQVSTRIARTEDDLLSDLEEHEGSLLLLILEEVQDPHNLGACWRSAEAFGAIALVTTTDHTVKETVTGKQSAAGAAETLPLVVVKNLARFLKELKKQESGW